MPDDLDQLRRRLDGMTDAEKVDALLAHVGVLTCDVIAEISGVMEATGLAFAPAQTLFDLYQMKGRIATHGFLAARAEATPRGFYPGPRALASRMKLIRPRLRELGWPVFIEPAYGIGYRLTVTDAKWVAPWEKNKET